MLHFPFWLVMSWNGTLLKYLMLNYWRNVMYRGTVEFTSSSNFTILHASQRYRTNRLLCKVKRIEVLTAVLLKTSFFWDVILCRLSGSYQNFEGSKMRLNIRNCKWWFISGSGFAGVGPDRYLWGTDAALILLFKRNGSKYSYLYREIIILWDKECMFCYVLLDVRINTNFLYTH